MFIPVWFGLGKMCTDNTPNHSLLSPLLIVEHTYVQLSPSIPYICDVTFGVHLNVGVIYRNVYDEPKRA